MSFLAPFFLLLPFQQLPMSPPSLPMWPSEDVCCARMKEWETRAIRPASVSRTSHEWSKNVRVAECGAAPPPCTGRIRTSRRSSYSLYRSMTTRREASTDYLLEGSKSDPGTTALLITGPPLLIESVFTNSPSCKKNWFFLSTCYWESCYRQCQPVPNITFVWILH